MAHVNGPTARATVKSTSWWWGQEQRLNFEDADTTQKATGATSAQQIDFVCVICTSNSSTAAVASLSLPLSLCVSLFKGTSQRYRHLSTCPFIFSQLQRSVCTNGIYSLLPQHIYRLRMCTTWYVPVVLLLLLPIFISLSLFVSLFRDTSHNIAISVPTLLFFRSYNEVFVQTAFIAYFPSGKYYFSM